MSTQIGDRQNVVDRLRGFAVIGVLIVNTPFLLTSTSGTNPDSMSTGWDLAAGYITWTFFQAKSYVIFAFLFGYSLMIFLDRASKKGIDARRAYRQRLLALAAFGIAHAVLLFVGDILFLYALLGSALVLLRTRSDRFILRLAAALFIAQVLLLTAAMAMLAAVPVDAAALSETAEIDRSWGQDGIVGSTLTRLEVWPYALLLIVVLQGLLIMSLFCVGIVAGRNRWLADPERHRALFHRIRSWGLIGGLPPALIAGALIVFPPLAFDGAGVLLGVWLLYLTAPLLSAGYIAAIALLPRRGLAKIAETDGAMSLTLYLGESVLMTFLAAGWGLGLFGMDTGPAFLVAIAVAVALSLAASLWCRRFTTGPIERLLRRLTYAGQSTLPAEKTAHSPS
jgi:uncharacterized protein